MLYSKFDLKKLPYRFQPADIAHVAWVDLMGNGIAVEVVVVALLANGDLYFIRVDHLDEIDRKRLLKILSRRDAGNYELWDLLSQQTLGNGMNALEFYQQFVRIRTSAGPIVPAGTGIRSFGNLSKFADVNPSSNEPTDASPDVRKGPGRPRKE